MVITCQQCSARLQLDDAKVPARPFTVRCPKCQHIINAQPPAPEPDYSPFGSGEAPLSAPTRFGGLIAAPPFRIDAAGGGAPTDGALASNRDEVPNLLSPS